MSLNTHTLIWLFPIAFMFHDFEEIILFEPWLRKNAAAIKSRIQNRVPAFLVKQIETILTKSTTEFTFPVTLIFALTGIAAFLAVEYASYDFLLLASGSFFLHGFMHLGQAIVLRRYVPAMISSALIVIPYGIVLYARLIEEKIVDMPELLGYFLIAIALTIPFILVMHLVGDSLYKKTIWFLIGPANN
jgi:hypothetical protein